MTASDETRTPFRRATRRLRDRARRIIAATAPAQPDPTGLGAGEVFESILRMSVVVVTVHVLFSPLYTRPLFTASLDLGILALAFYCWWLVRRGRLRRAGVVASVAGWLGNTIAVFFIDGVYSNALPGYFVVVMIVGFVWSVRAAIATAALTWLTVLAMVIAQGYDLLPVALARTPTQSFVTFTLQLTIIATILFLALHRIRRAFADAAASGERYRNLIEHSPLGVMVLDRNLIVLSANQALHKIIGAPPTPSLVGGSFSSSLIYRDPGVREVVHNCLERGERGVYELEWTTAWKRQVYFRVHVAPIRELHGEIVGCQVLLEDVAEQRRLEDQLRQSQKMEVVGQLAGGIAHDFNNYLTVILGNAEAMVKRFAGDDPQIERVREIQHAANRSSALTRQLLAFSSRQVMEPQVVDLNRLVASSHRMLRRLLGDHVTLHTALDGELGRVKVDPSQTEQVIVNLAVNARDAMPDGGRLVIETANIEVDRTLAAAHPELVPGPYVKLSVEDNGAGIDPELLPRIFEPFFTTKQPGEGSGLGLATVYGIVRQSGGAVVVSSQPGEGSLFDVYLPRVDDEASATELEPSSEELPAGCETILLVEDDSMVRALAHNLLAESGYTVLTATNGAEAVEVARQRSAAIDLLLTDVMMPEMGGIELAELFQEEHPKAGILFMSGYARDRAVRSVTKAVVVRKPFNSQQLLLAVRRALDRRSGSELRVSS